MFPLIRVGHHLLLLFSHRLFKPDLPHHLPLTLTVAPGFATTNINNDITPRLLIERHALFVLPPHPTLLPIQHGGHGISEQTTIGCGLLQLLDAFEVGFLDPLGVRLFESELWDMERFVPGF